MIFNIDTHGGVPIYRQVIEQVKRQIVTGQMEAGEQLESVKNLAERLKVNPMTISKAYGFLVQEGLVERRRGVGLFVVPMQRERRQRLKSSMLDEALRRAARLTVQMEVSAEEASTRFAEHLEQIASQKGGVQRTKRGSQSGNRKGRSQA